MSRVRRSSNLVPWIVAKVIHALGDRLFFSSFTIFIMKPCLVFVITAALLFSRSDAAVITWGVAQDTTTSAANDVVDGGDVVLAINGQSQSNTSPLRPGSVTLDGIVFDSPDYDNFLGRLATAEQAALSLNPGQTTGDSDYDLFLNHVAFANTSNATNTANTGLSGTDDDAVYPIQGLTTNTDYLIQLWYTDERTQVPPRTAIFGDNEASQNTVNVPGRGANGFGSFVVGTFTADSSSQDLRLQIEGSTRAHLTGLLVRAVAIPEPSHFAIIALGAIVAVGRRGRRTKSA